MYEISFSSGRLLPRFVLRRERGADLGFGKMIHGPIISLQTVHATIVFFDTPRLFSRISWRNTFIKKFGIPQS
jgi:hypothetical protein